MEVSFRRVDWEFSKVFRIAYRTQTVAQTVVVELRDGSFTGRGAAAGVSYHGETVDTLHDQLTAVAADLRKVSRERPAELLPSGGRAMQLIARSGTWRRSVRVAAPGSWREWAPPFDPC